MRIRIDHENHPGMHQTTTVVKRFLLKLDIIKQRKQEGSMLYTVLSPCCSHCPPHNATLRVLIRKVAPQTKKSVRDLRQHTCLL